MCSLSLDSAKSFPISTIPDPVDILIQWYILSGQITSLSFLQAQLMSSFGSLWNLTLIICLLSRGGKKGGKSWIRRAPVVMQVTGLCIEFKQMLNRNKWDTSMGLRNTVNLKSQGFQGPEITLHISDSHFYQSLDLGINNCLCWELNHFWRLSISITSLQRITESWYQFFAEEMRIYISKDILWFSFILILNCQLIPFRVFFWLFTIC